MYTTFHISIHQLIDAWVVSTCSLLWTTLCKFLYRNIFSILLGTNLGVEFLGDMITMFNILGNFQILSQRGYTILHFTSSVWGVQFLHILVSLVITFLYVVFPVGSNSSLWFQLICISLITNAIGHLFMYLLATRISSLGKYVFISYINLETRGSFWYWNDEVKFIYFFCLCFLCYTKNMSPDLRFTLGFFPKSFIV